MAEIAQDKLRSSDLRRLVAQTFQPSALKCAKDEDDQTQPRSR